MALIRPKRNLVQPVTMRKNFEAATPNLDYGFRSGRVSVCVTDYVLPSGVSPVPRPKRNRLLCYANVTWYGSNYLDVMSTALVCDSCAMPYDGFIDRTPIRRRPVGRGILPASSKLGLLQC